MKRKSKIAVTAAIRARLNHALPLLLTLFLLLVLSFSFFSLNHRDPRLTVHQARHAPVSKATV